ncbi:Nucleolar protein 16 [Aphelenchoides fujianensis]|nr:Nucleolar protein 16 [Aphelenchoides fujianensis]
MPKSVKAVKSGRSKRTHRNKKNLAKRQKLKLKRKIGKPGDSHVLAPIWDKKKTIGSNLKAAGLVSDPNRLIKLKDDEVEVMDLDQVRNGVLDAKPKKIKTKKAKGYAKELEKQAKTQEAEKAAAGRPPPRLSASDVAFCESMVAKHGLDYEAMAKDRDNIYQNTAKQLERKIATFKRYVAATSAMET